MPLDTIKNTKKQAKDTVKNDWMQAATLMRKKLSKIDMRLATQGVINQRFLNARKSEWKGINIRVAKLLNIIRRTVQTIIENMVEGKNITQRRKGGGEKPRINPGNKKSARLVGGLQLGLGCQHTATKINELGVSPGKKPSSKSTVPRVAKKNFGMQRSKLQIIKTGSRYTESAWAKARLAIMLHFCGDIRTKKSL